MKCANCEKEDGPVYCASCRVSFCEPCKILIHESRWTQYHVMLSVDKYEQYMNVLRPVRMGEEGTVKTDDGKNEFMKWNADRNEIQLCNGFQFYRNMESCGIVSFVGFSETGKSTLAAFLGDGHVSNRSRTVYSHFGDRKRNKDPYIILDPNGFSWDEENIQRHIAGIQYRISNVVCFVFNGAICEQQTVLKYLVSIADSGPADSLDKPALVIIFNKYPETFQIDFQKWLAVDIDILKFYSNPKILVIPDLIGNLPIIDDIISKIRETVESQLLVSSFDEARTKDDVCHLLENLLQ